MRGDKALFDDALSLAEIRSLEDVPVFSRSGAKLGELQGVLISKLTGTITYFLLRRSSLMGLRSKRYILNRDALSLDAERDGFALADEAAREQMQPATTAIGCPHRSALRALGQRWRNVAIPNACSSIAKSR